MTTTRTASRNSHLVLRFVAGIYFSIAAISLYQGLWAEWRWLGWLLMGTGVLLMAQLPVASFQRRMQSPLGIAAYGSLLAGIIWMSYLLFR